MRYWYFASTLPGFLFGAQPPFSEAEFLGRCEHLLDPVDYAEIESCVDRLLALGEPLPTQSAFLGQFIAWERSFRRQLAMLRAQAAGKDFSRYLIGFALAEGAVQAAASCFASTDPYQAEIAFERERWSAAERFSVFSTFDLDFIAAYRIKLNVACRLARLDKARGVAGYRRLYDEILGGAPGAVETLTSGAQA
ncbi:MAG: hypothetical protein NT061_05045 [Spirochaetes bacterium]|nr:hypothetical protein [Spirochaetota bacterium]